MTESFVGNIRNNQNFNTNECVYNTILKEYERVVFESLITSFGLDFIIDDVHGGDVDTVYNVRAMGEDKELKYKNADNAKDYASRGEYISREYHQDEKYKSINAKVSEKRKAGKLKDAYTGKRMARNAKVDLDHVVAANEIHEDPGRVLAGLDGTTLANCEENLKATDRSINRSMKADNIDDFLDKLNLKNDQRKERIKDLNSRDTLTDKERKELNKLEKLDNVDHDLAKEQNRKAREAYNQKINRAYYSSKKFASDVAKSASKRGVQMGSRQAMGFIFAEIWFAAREELENLPAGCEFKDTLDALGKGIRIGVENAKTNYTKLLGTFFSGVEAGALASLTSTLCNIFSTTSKNLGKCIRNIYASLTQAGRVLLFNPDNLFYGERIKTAMVIMATGTSVLVGTTVGETIGKTPIGMMPVVGEIVQVFCSTLISGMLSCSFVIMLDRSRFVNQIVDNLNRIPDRVKGYMEIADIFERLAAQIENFDIDKFENEVGEYKNISLEIMRAKDESQVNQILINAHEMLGVKLPWEGKFDNFMTDKNVRLVFD